MEEQKYAFKSWRDIDTTGKSPSLHEISAAPGGSRRVNSASASPTSLTLRTSGRTEGDTPVLSRVPHSSHPKLHPQKVYYFVTSFQMLCFKTEKESNPQVI